MSASDVVGQVTDGNGRGTATGVSLHPQDLAGINLTAASRDLVDVTSLTRSSTGRDELGRARDVIHRPRDIQRALEVLGSLENSAASGIFSVVCNKKKKDLKPDQIDSILLKKITFLSCVLSLCLCVAWKCAHVLYCLFFSSF